METMIEDSISWIRELVKAEDQMEDAGVVVLAEPNKERIHAEETLRFLRTLKNKFIDASVTFNELKTSALGRLKIYGIAKTHADFMLFRNGYKMIFAMTGAGEISIRFNFFGAGAHIPAPVPGLNAQGVTAITEEHILKIAEGPFGEVMWTFKDQVINLEALVKYHLKLFIRESAK